MTDTALITVSRLPEIQENLRMLRESWEQKATDAASLVCTEDTVQSIKKIRADMRKEFEEADKQRKAAKLRYMAPWNEVEETYRECVENAFRSADSHLKSKIDEFEDELKARCRAEIQDYFDELCAAHGIDFLSLDTALNIGSLKISLSDAKSKSAKKLKDDLRAVVSRVSDAIEQIETMDDDERAEIMAEYKTIFDVGHAIATVRGRKRRIEAEREAAESRRIAQERVSDAERKVEAVAPPVAVEAPREPERRFERFSFTVRNVTRSQLIQLREYLKREGIEYE